jgi:hypothetical protein
MRVQAMLTFTFKITVDEWMIMDAYKGKMET